MCQITLSMLVVGSTWHCFNLRNVFAGEPAFAYCGDKEAGGGNARVRSPAHSSLHCRAQGIPSSVQS